MQELRSEPHPGKQGAMELEGDIFDDHDRQLLCDWLETPGRRWSGMFPDASLQAPRFQIREDRVYFGTEAYSFVQDRLVGKQH